MNTINLNEYYEVVMNEMFYCCDEYQDRIICISHGEDLGCVYCVGDYSIACECED